MTVKNIIGSLKGAGVGLLAGLATGVSGTDWLRLAITSMILGFAVKSLAGYRSGSAINSYKVAFAGLACFLAVLTGLYINEQKVFTESPKHAVSHLINQGITAPQAREMYVKQILPDFKNAELK
jgi:hypothetical protein